MAPEHLQELLSSHDFVIVIKEGYLPFRVGSTSPNDKNLFTEADLTALDPRLVRVFRHIVNGIKKELTPELGEPAEAAPPLMFTLIDIKAAIQAFAHPPVLVIQAAQRKEKKKLHLTGIRSVNTDHPRFYRIVAEHYTMVRTDCGLEYPSGSCYGLGAWDVQREVLDTPTPGWLERYRIAEGLDLSPTERAAFAFEEMPPAQAIDMTSVQFDE